MGAGDDAMVTAREVGSTAAAYGVKPIVFERLAHDMMLDSGWRTVADRIISELDALFPERRASDEQRRQRGVEPIESANCNLTG